MYITVGEWKPIACSKCGSFKAVKPINERGVAIRCLDCGHQKLDPPPPSAAVGAYAQGIAAKAPNEKPTF